MQLFLEGTHPKKAMAIYEPHMPSEDFETRLEITEEGRIMVEEVLTTFAYIEGKLWNHGSTKVSDDLSEGIARALAYVIKLK
jgi:hypothetical protein